MKSLLFVAMLFLGDRFQTSLKPWQPFIDPTGTYTLTGTVKKNRTIGHSGEIRVLLLSQERVALTMYINKGYPGYESGAIVDTLSYLENMAKYTPANETSCTIVFLFTGKTVEIGQLMTDPRSGCGFASGVLEATVFQKTSEYPPVIQDLSARGESH